MWWRNQSILTWALAGGNPGACHSGSDPGPLAGPLPVRGTVDFLIYHSPFFSHIIFKLITQIPLRYPSLVAQNLKFCLTEPGRTATEGGIVEKPSFWFPFCGFEKCAKITHRKESSSHEFDWVWSKLGIPSFNYNFSVFYSLIFMVLKLKTSLNEWFPTNPIEWMIWRITVWSIFEG